MTELYSLRKIWVSYLNTQGKPTSADCGSATSRGEVVPVEAGTLWETRVAFEGFPDSAALAKSWWRTYRELKRVADKNQPVEYLIMEGEETLLHQPAQQPGRDFAVFLSALERLGYAVEWRTIPRGDAGHRSGASSIIVVAYHVHSVLWKFVLASLFDRGPAGWIVGEGVVAQAFPAVGEVPTINCPNLEVSHNPRVTLKALNDRMEVDSPFRNAGLLIGGQVWTANVESSGDQTQLNVPEVGVPPHRGLSVRVLEELVPQVRIRSSALTRFGGGQLEQAVSEQRA